MKLHIEWAKPLALKDATRENMIYLADVAKLPDAPGIYVFGRRWGKDSLRHCTSARLTT
jgi:hypothetical protein